MMLSAASSAGRSEREICRWQDSEQFLNEIKRLLRKDLLAVSKRLRRKRF
jgi:hypothetical protein